MATQAASRLSQLTAAERRGLAALRDCCRPACDLFGERAFARLRFVYWPCRA